MSHFNSYLPDDRERIRAFALALAITVFSTFAATILPYRNRRVAIGNIVMFLLRPSPLLSGGPSLPCCSCLFSCSTFSILTKCRTSRPDKARPRPRFKRLRSTCAASPGSKSVIMTSLLAFHLLSMIMRSMCGSSMTVTELYLSPRIRASDEEAWITGWAVC